MRLAIAALAAGVVLTGCQEKLTSPGDCPALCPGGEPQVFDEVFTPIAGTDSSFRGYIQPYSSRALLVANGLNGLDERGVIRFSRRPDSVRVRDTLRTYTIDSVAFGLTIVARDTSLNGLQVELYRLPASIDTTTTFAAVDPAFAPGNLVTTISVPDTLNSGLIRTVLQGPDLARVAIPPADSGVLALGLRISSATPTGVRLGTIASGTSGVFVTYATLAIPDTGTAKLRTFALTPEFNSSLTPVQQPDDPTLLAVGGEPSARALLRFALPARITDSATIVRATLQLTPTVPIQGLPGDSASLEARAVLADLGAKSSVCMPPARCGGFIVSSVSEVPLDPGSNLPVEIEVTRLVRTWQGSGALPAALSVLLHPEAASFSMPVFFSTRSPTGTPQLRIAYSPLFRFETP